MRVVIVGAGNLATNLAVALQKAGHVLIQVFSRTAQSAELLAKRVGVPAVTDLHQLAQDADLYIVSISDSALPTLDYSAFPSQALVVHTAGSIGWQHSHGCHSSDSSRGVLSHADLLTSANRRLP